MNVALQEYNPKNLEQSFVIQEIENHVAWHGHISGLEAQKLLIGKKTPYLFISRKGEFNGDYYVSFLDSTLTVVHQPFAISITTEGWHCQNGGSFGPLTRASFDDILHLMMHCKKVEPTPKTSITYLHDSSDK